MPKYRVRPSPFIENVRILDRIKSKCKYEGVRSLWSYGNALLDASEPSPSKEWASRGRDGRDGQEAGRESVDNVESDDEYEKKIKGKILAASLKYVNEFGWSQRAISLGAESIGYPGVIHGMFPNAGAELVHHFQANCNARLLNILEEQVRAVVEGRAKRLPPDRQLQSALEQRLRMVIPYKRHWPQALALASLPPSIPSSLANFLQLLDDLCYYAGDRSVDFSWYTRRATLAAIYKSTELYMLQDDSEEHKRTWEFLEKRIQQVAQIGGGIPSAVTPFKGAAATNGLSELAGAFYNTACNMLGINSRAQGERVGQRLDEPLN